MMRPDAAIILAAGLGLRMRPLTDHLPKPLIQVRGKCLIDYALDFAAAGGVERAVVNASYKAELLEAHLKTRTHPAITVSREPEPLETGGGVREALPFLGPQPFFCINSDVICVNHGEHALQRLTARWDDARMDSVLLLHPVDRAIGYSGPGDFFLNDDGTLKRRGDAPSAPFVFAGVQLMHPRLFAGCPPTGKFSLNLLYNKNMQTDGTLPRIFGIIHDGDWLHVGDPAGRELAEEHLGVR